MLNLLTSLQRANRLINAYQALTPEYGDMSDLRVAIGDLQTVLTVLAEDADDDLVTDQPEQD